MISPLKYLAAASRQEASVTSVSPGTRCDSTSVLTPASAAILADLLRGRVARQHMLHQVVERAGDLAATLRRRLASMAAMFIAS